MYGNSVMKISASNTIDAIRTTHQKAKKFVLNAGSCAAVSNIRQRCRVSHRALGVEMT
jgi:hypothetical protein